VCERTTVYTWISRFQLVGRCIAPPAVVEQHGITVRKVLTDNANRPRQR
jgi:hypothetical protein